MARAWKSSGGPVREKACDFELLGTRMREHVVEGMAEFSKPVRSRMLRSLRETLKENAVADPDMCDFAKIWVKRTINLFWADLTDFLNVTIDDGMEQAAERKEHASLASIGETPRFLMPGWFRAKILYCVVPFDKSIFGQVKDPLFWFCTVLSMISWGGVRIGFYGTVLACLLTYDPDEFQLVQFITLLKGTFFLSGGVIAGIKTAFGYLLCVQPGGCHTCDIDGPAYSFDLYGAAIDLFGSCALAWMAFGCLRWSVHHGWHKISEADVENSTHHHHGGHLGHLFLYDFLCIILSALVFCVLAYLDSEIKEAHEHAVHLGLSLCPGYGAGAPSLGSVDAVPIVPQHHHFSEWDFHRAFLFARIIYAMMSTPFVLFKLPGLNTILTHTTMTGFNKQGHCVIFCLPPVK
mmetsp:Transcript_12199/g.38523  ORF Transcript_12199/g.38523 Transcript_12199/m.38523 type:complete len:407 (-) Transcript_12199:7-1227(-)